MEAKSSQNTVYENGLTLGIRNRFIYVKIIVNRKAFFQKHHALHFEGMLIHAILLCQSGTICD
jgi:hypothetical protein